MSKARAAKTAVQKKRKVQMVLSKVIRLLKKN